jgi:hypothetical protein
VGSADRAADGDLVPFRDDVLDLLVVVGEGGAQHRDGLLLEFLVGGAEKPGIGLCWT